MTAQTRSDIVGLLERHGLTPRKSYGQHFLADPNLVQKIVSVAGVNKGDRVIEIGAGTGALTLALATAGAEVVAYEVDQRLQPLLEEVLGGAGVEVRYSDVTEVDLAAILGDRPWKLVANLPYNVGTSLILDILLHVRAITSLTVMVQEEVADRLVARAGTDAYGLPSVVVALTAEVRDRFTVPPQVFVPPPRVSSGVVRLDRVEMPELGKEAVELARVAFGQRRKMLRRSLAGRVDEKQFEQAGISPVLRPEELSAEHFLALAGAVADG